jgi:hypothetical protein
MTSQATLEMDWPELIKQLIELVVPQSDDILSSAAKLGSLLTICSEFAEIEPVVRERAATVAMQRKEIPGWVLVHRDGNRYVEAQQLIELCLHCPVSNLQKLLTTLAIQLGNVSETKYQLLCESAGLVSQTETIQQASATVFLRRNPTTNNTQR